MISFADVYDDAISQAMIDKKPVFLYFGATWCGPCQQMKKHTFTDPEVKEALLNCHVIIVDIDQSPALKQRFNIRAVPTYCLIKRDGTILLKESGSMGPDDFIRWLVHTKGK